MGGIRHLKVKLDGLARLHTNGLLDGLKADGLGNDRMLTNGEILQEEVARGIGHKADGGILDGDGYEGDVLACLSVDDVSVNVGVGATTLSRQSACRAYAKGHSKGYDKKNSGFHLKYVVM